MAIITSDNRSAWQQLADDLAPQRPSVGKRVLVTAGKHKNKEGEVTWHGRDKFSGTWRYCDEAQGLLREMEGRRGYRVRIGTGSEAFFVDADKVEVIN